MQSLKTDFLRQLAEAAQKLSGKDDQLAQAALAIDSLKASEQKMRKTMEETVDN